MADSSTQQPGSPGVAPSPQVAAAFRHCHAVTRRRARNFYYGLKLTPEPKRSALFAVYAFMRACDDLADGDDPPRTDAEVDAAGRRIESFRDAMRAAIDPRAPLPPGPVWPALRHVRAAYGIDAAHLHAMLDGQRMDLTHRRYRTFDDLYRYCYRVASVVGLVCLDVWGHDGEPGVEKLAEYRGVAFQLTNILRDLVEDADRDRVYLPQEDLDRFGVAWEQLRDREPSPGFERLMIYQVERALSYYQMSETLERHIAPDCRATSWAMTQIYRRLLQRIAHDPAAVLRRRVRLGSLQKLGIAMGATWKRWT